MDLQEALQYYAMERFLFRRSAIPWSGKLVVKGAAMLRVWDAAVARPTRDIDFLGRIDNTPEAVKKIVAECLARPIDDGLIFSETVDATRITVEDRYPGVRVRLSGDLVGSRFVLRLDIGIDDAAIPEPGWVDFPSLLGDASPRILAYHPATAIAEKVQAMVELGLSNSRLKDYYDVWMLSRTLEFDGDELVSALRATFQRRETELPRSTPPELTVEFTEQAGTVARWASYRASLAKAHIDAPESLTRVALEIADFVTPAMSAAATGAEFRVTWLPGLGWRERP
jgi:hypothetical protein